MKNRTGRDAREDAFFGSEATRHHERLFKVHIENLGVGLAVQDGGNEVGANSLNLVGAGRSTIQDGRLSGLHPNDLHAGLALFQNLAHAGDGAAGADSRKEDVNLAVGVCPNFFGRRRAVNGNVGLVLELPGQDGAGSCGGNFFGFGNGALHPLGSGGQDNLGTVRSKQHATLHAHAVGHGQDDLVAASRTDQSQGDSGVSAGALHNRAAGLQRARLLSSINNGLAETVLHTVAGVVELELGQDGGAGALAHAVDAHEGRVAGQVGDVVVNASSHEDAFSLVGGEGGHPLENEASFKTKRLRLHRDILLRSETTMTNLLTLDTLRLQAMETLSASGITDSDVDAELLIGHVLGLGRGEVQARLILNDLVSHDNAQLIRSLVARRSAREPLQHILGVAWFRSLTLEVGPGVFVPRPETEQLAQLAIDALRSLADPAPIGVDLGTGSGAIALAMASEVPHARIFAVEKSPEAMPWTSKNFAQLGAGNATLIQGDLADAFPELNGTVAVVASNPPYIPTDAVPRDPEVQLHDPHLALYGGHDGLDVVRLVSHTALRLLRSGGALMMEHGELQGAAIRTLLLTDGWRAPATHRDLLGRDRYTTATRS